MTANDMAMKSLDEKLEIVERIMAYISPPKIQRNIMHPSRSHQVHQNDNTPFRELMAAMVDRQDLNAKYLQKLAEERTKEPLPRKGNGQSPQNRVNKPMVLDSSAKTAVVTETQGFPKIDQSKQKKGDNGKKDLDQVKSPYDKMEAVRSYARRREQIKTNKKDSDGQSSQRPTDLLDAASIDSGCSSDKSTDGDMRRVERILQSVNFGKTKAAGYTNDARAARRLHYVVGHGQGGKAAQRKPRQDNMNKFYTPSLDSNIQGHPRTKSVPSSWQPHGEMKSHPKYRSPSDAVCKYYCRNYPDYLREMQMERILKQQQFQQRTVQDCPAQEAGLGHDLREMVKPSSPNKYNQQYSFACVNVKKPLRLPKLSDKVSDSSSSHNANATDMRNNRKKDPIMSSKDIVSLRTKIRTNYENSPRLAGQHNAPDNMTRNNGPVHVPCPPQTTGMQKYFDRGTNAARIRQGYGAGTMTYTANPRATGYANGGVISFRGGKETVYMLKELGDPQSIHTPENTLAGSQVHENEMFTGAEQTQQKPRSVSCDSSENTNVRPVRVPGSRSTPTDFQDNGVLDNSRWVGRIYQTENAVLDQGNDSHASQPAGQNVSQEQTSHTGVTSNQPTFGSVRVIPALDKTETQTVDSRIVVEPEIDIYFGSSEQGPDNIMGHGEVTSKDMTSLLSVPMVHAERIRTLEEGFQGNDGDLSIPEIRMITATPLPPDYEA